MKMESEAKRRPAVSKNRRYRFDTAICQDDPEASHSLLEDSDELKSPVVIVEKTRKYDQYESSSATSQDSTAELNESNPREPLLKSILKETKPKATSPPGKCEIADMLPCEKVHKLVPNSNNSSSNTPSIENKERSSRELPRKYVEPTKTAVRFGESNPNHLHPTAGPSGQTFRQRASFQSETRNLSSCPEETLGHQDSGVVCSNNDLNLILCEANHLRRNSTDTKHERAKSTRSLSFDSSAFRFRRGNSFDSSIWFSKNASPLHPRQPMEEFHSGSQKSIIQIRVTAESPEMEGDKLDELYAEGTGNQDLENQSDTIVLMTEDDTSKVTWDEESIVDASVLGSAIEAYLNSEERRLSQDQGRETLKPPPQVTVENSSICSTLKSMFVK